MTKLFDDLILDCDVLIHMDRILKERTWLNRITNEEYYPKKFDDLNSDERLDVVKKVLIEEKHRETI